VLVIEEMIRLIPGEIYIIGDLCTVVKV